MTIQDSTDVATSGVDSDGDAASTRRADRRRRTVRRRRRSGVLYGIAVVLLAGAIPVLGYVGVRVILDSSDGEVVDPVLDPDEPGYRALIQPSPTMLLIHENEEGNMVGGTVLALASTEGDGGSVMVFPPGLVGDVPDVGPITVDGAFVFSGGDAARSVAEWAMHIGVPDVVVMSDAELAEMVAASGPITIQNPDTVRLADGTTFPAGPLVLQPEEVPRFMGHLDPGESRLNQLLRQELVWNAWIDQLGNSGAVAFPGEQDAGLARFLTGIVDGENRVESVPLIADAEAERGGSTADLLVDEEAFAAMVPALIPFPTGAGEGDRFIVRVLAGTEDSAAVPLAARRIIAGGGQINMVGNADEFGQVTTEIIYYDPARRRDAERVAEALGFGTVIRIDEIDDTADVVVVLGADADL